MSTVDNLHLHERELATEAAFAKPVTHLDDVIAFVEGHCTERTH